MEKYETSDIDYVEIDNSLKKISLPQINECEKDEFIQNTTNCYINNLSENDKLTLELLTNRSQYKKCLSLVDPNKYIETQQHLDKYNRYYTEILKLTNELLDNPDKTVSREINDSFDNYIKGCVRHFELEEMKLLNENYNNKYTNDNYDDTDVLFGNMNNNNSPETYENVVLPPRKPVNYSKSFFGKNIYKLH